MSFIPVFFLPFEDELLYSWILRLANANGLRPVTFLNLYSGNDENIIHHWNYDVSRFFLPICQHTYYPIDIRELNYKHSTFNLDMSVLKESQQIRYINNVFRPISTINKPQNSNIKNVKYCPECLQDEPIPYLHVSHNLEGVSVCWKHGCRLRKFTGIWGHELEFNEENYEDIVLNNCKESALAYAEYVNTLNKTPINYNIIDIKTVLMDELKQLSYVPFDNYQTLLDDISKWGYKDLIQNDICKLLKKKMLSAKSISHMELIPLLMFLFPNPNDLLARFKNQKVVLQMRECPVCNHKYFTAKYSNADSWGCPQCNLQIPESELFKRIVNDITKGEYFVVGEFKSLNEKIEICHRVCGKRFFVKPRDFLFQDTRCLCENRITFKQVQKIIEKDGEYKLIKFKNVSSRITVQHNKCGTIQQRNYAKFIKRPQCKVCHHLWGNALTTDIFKARVKILTGDEYEVTSDYINAHTDIEILHVTCGTKQSYAPHKFLGGQRCSFCLKSLKFTPKWNIGFDYLLKYKEEFGNVNVPVRCVYLGYSLGKWCSAQRASYREGKLQPDKKKKLDDVGFSFNALSDEWNRRYEQYKRYIEQNGTAAINQLVDFEGEHLGKWVYVQSYNHKHGKLTQDRVNKMRLLDPDTYK